MPRKHKGRKASIVAILCVSLAYREQAEVVLLAVVALATILAVIRLYHAIQRRSLSVDNMSGLAFERYVADLLSKRGYTNIQLTEHYDFGVDIVADKAGVRWGIQVKRYSGLVKAEAVRQVVTALPLYGCDQAMVITNSTFSHVAQVLAESNNCVLVDRRKLFSGL